MAQICLTLPPCWPLQVPLACRAVPDISCLGVDDFAVSEVKPGGRTVLVTPYDPNGTGNTICSGQYGQWQVLTGLGGQINRGLYAGKSFQKDLANYGAPGISSTVDKTDCCNPGDKCIAIRDRGRWYVSKLGGDGGGGGVAGEVFPTAIVYGGNSNTGETVAPFSSLKQYIYKLDRFPSPKDPAKASDWTKLDLPLTFNHNDAIPAAPNTNTHAWPEGVGIARLARGSANVGGSAWNADLDPVSPLANVPARPLQFFTRVSTDNTKIYCYFDKPSITAADYTKITLNGGKTVSAATISGPVLTLTVSPVITSGDLTLPLIVTFLSKALSVCTDLATGDNVYLSPQAVNVSTVNNDSPIAVPDVKIRAAVINPGALNKIVVSMSGCVDNAASAGGWTIAGGTPALTISSAAVTSGADGTIMLTLDRPITVTDLSSAITVSHTSGITTQTALQAASPLNIPAGPCIAGGPVDTVFKAARSCYVLVANRFTETDYKATALVDIVPTSFIDLKDANGVVRRVYDTLLREGAVESTSTGSTMQVLVVQGGNALGATGFGIKSVPGVITDAAWFTPPSNLSCTATVGGGAVTAILAGGGQGYSVAPTITIAPPPGPGTQATASCVLESFPEAIKITNGGSNYYQGDGTVFTMSNGGAGYAIIANGKIVQCIITNIGNATNTPPTVTFTKYGVPDTGGATVEVLMRTGVPKVTLTDGGTGYTSPPSVTATLNDFTLVTTDGVGYGYSAGGAYYEAGAYQPIPPTVGGFRIVNDNRSMIRFPLVGHHTSGGYEQAGDAITTWSSVGVAVTGATADSWPVMTAWLPQGAGV